MVKSLTKRKPRVSRRLTYEKGDPILQKFFESQINVNNSIRMLIYIMYAQHPDQDVLSAYGANLDKILHVEEDPNIKEIVKKSQKVTPNAPSTTKRTTPTPPVQNENAKPIVLDARTLKDTTNVSDDDDGADPLGFLI